jgi:hypothetical protein
VNYVAFLLAAITLLLVARLAVETDKRLDAIEGKSTPDCFTLVCEQR